MQKTDFILLAAGKGKRLWPITENIPKTMVRVMEKPIMEWMVKSIAPLANKIIIVVGAQKESIIEHFNKSKYAKQIVFVEQTEQKGTGHAPLIAEKEVTTDNFVVLAADIFWAKEFYELLAHEIQKSRPFIAGIKVEDGSKYGVMETRGGKLVKILEKPPNVKNCLAYASAYFVPREFFTYLHKLQPSPRGELEVTDALTEFSSKHEMNVMEFNGFWTDIGYFWHLLNANQYALEHLMKSKILGEVEKSVVVNGKLFVGKGSKVIGPSTIDGNVYIGENCWIGPFSLLKNCTIESNCGIGSSEVKRSIVMRDSNAYHFTHIGDAVICEDVNFGAGSQSANLRFDDKNVPVEIEGKKIDSGRRKLGCVIGSHTKLGCNAVISPGKLIGSNCKIAPNVTLNKNLASGEIFKG